MPIDEFCIAPYGGSLPSGEQSYAFAVFRMVFQVIVAAAEHASFREACIDRSRRMVMSNGAMLLPDIAATFAAVRARGCAAVDEREGEPRICVAHRRSRRR